MNTESGIPVTGLYADEAPSGYIEPPTSTQFHSGVEPEMTLPAAWWNYFVNLFTNTNIKAKEDITAILAELNNALTTMGITPDPEASNQLATLFQNDVLPVTFANANMNANPYTTSSLVPKHRGNIAINTTTRTTWIATNTTAEAASWSRLWSPENDGAGSGLDADTVDGIQGSQIMRSMDDAYASTVLDDLTTDGVYVVVYSGQGSSTLLVFGTKTGGSTSTVQMEISWSSGALFTGGIRFRNKTDSLNWTAWRTIWTNENDGSGSGLDADTVDGSHYNATDILTKLKTVDGSSSGLDADKVDGIDFVNGAAGSDDYFTVSKASTLIIPKGLYMMAGEPDTHLQVNYSGSWFGSAPSGGLVLSDGVNYRLKNVNTTYNTRVDYRKLA